MPIGDKVHDATDYKPRIVNDETAQPQIEAIIEDSAHILDLRNLPADSLISQAIGITDDNGKPGALVISLAKGEADEEGVVKAESERTTIIIPISHGFAFGNGIIVALDKAADAMVDDKVKQIVERIFGGDR